MWSIISRHSLSLLGLRLESTFCSFCVLAALCEKVDSRIFHNTAILPQTLWIATPISSARNDKKGCYVKKWILGLKLVLE
ncbi:hypothetical protein NYG90_05980 [Helicobacter sp. XJK30-2]|uniref:Uncharacterized protein n=1 Tax=Helicobacter zhangjianzhongii TaxID=2974574 RepID=A0ACC6FTF8_9HELI|nr:hypothetical protein [Helicobacter sp. XJK30-2]MDL0082223.1 hypothetical protein [Helicobacter sp. XJK30-2]